MVRKADKAAAEVEATADTIENKRLESLAFDQGVRKISTSH